MRRRFIVMPDHFANPMLRKKRRPALIVAALVAMTSLTFMGVLACGFVSYDDPSFVTQNVMVNQGLRPAAAWWAFTAAHGANWNPVTALSHMLACSWFDLDPAAHHAVNLLLHVVNVALLFLVWRRISGELWPSAAVAALFALHPLHVESVAWVSQRKDLLSTLFWFLAIWAHAEYARAPSRLRYAAVSLSCVLALASKAMAVTLPLTLLLIDYWPLRRWPEISWPRLLREKVPLFVLCAADAVITVLVLRAEGALDANAALPVLLRLSNAVVSCVRYLEKTIWPATLSPFYPYPASWPVLAVCGSLALLLLVSWLAWRTRQRAPWVAFGWLWFLLTLLPVIGISPLGAHSMADRYTYVSLIGIFTLAVWTVADWCRSGSRGRVQAAAVAGACVLVACSWASVRQIGIWKSPETLVARLRTVAGEHPVVIDQTAITLTLRGQPVESVEAEYRRGLALHPRDAHFLLDMSLVEARLGRFVEAKALIERAQAIVPTNPGWRFNLGSILMTEGRVDEAVITLREALRVHPNIGSGYGLIGRIRMRQGRWAEAVEAFQQAVACDRWDWLSRNELGVALFQQGRPAEAVAAIEEAQWINPGDAGVRDNLARMRQSTPALAR